MTELKPPREWAKEQGVTILDADGWADPESFEEPISAEEFAQRLELCTTDALAKAITVRCLDCPASWLMTGTPAPCFAQGHRAELNGVPVEYNPAMNGFGR